MNFNRSDFFDFLHIFVLVGFAVAQPIYDILGQNPEFFVSHKASPILILAMVLALSFGLALVLIVFELAAWFVGATVRRSLHWILILGLAILIALPVAKRLVGGSDFTGLGIATLMGVTFVILYIRLQTVRMFLTVLSPSVLVFPLWFLLTPPVERLVMPNVIDAWGETEIKNPVPVVLVVLDEFNITALLDAAGRIDPVRFPNFAALAAESWWFPNAISASGSTERALPAILTGRQPQPDVQLSPTANDYPNNLFVLLGKQYRLNVWESVTTLCPDLLCRQEGDADAMNDYAAFFSDIAVIYLHLLAPPKLEQRLPSLGAQWTGFGEAVMAESIFADFEVGDSPEPPSKSLINRDSQLANFLSQIEKSSKPTLHFLHVLLPHVTYEYLPSGHKYFPGEGRPFPDGIINDKGVWIGTEPLILTAYHRYLQQVGYVDRFLGQLRNALESSNLYDNALVILTADHGVSFRSGFSRRGVENGNERDILKVPMIVKLPGQREGRVSKQLVSGIDVLPTIVDVLKVKLPWIMDGYSMFDKDRRRTGIEIAGVRNFKSKELNEPSILKWQIDHFGEHTSLDHLVPKGSYPSMIGRELSDFRIGRPAATRFINSDLNHFENVNPEGGFLPALFRGHLTETNNQNLRIAVALNGRIWATTQTSKWKGNHNYFSVLLPPAAFTNGQNVAGVYLIEETGGELILVPLNDGRQDVSLHHDKSGRLTLFFPDGHEIPVVEGPDIFRGGMGLVTSMGNMLVIEGWAADIEEPQPVATVLIFSGEQLVSQVKPAISRPDVVNVHKHKDLLYSGFRAVVPLDVLKSPVTEIRVIVISQSNRAIEFHFNDDQKDLIGIALENGIS